MMHHDTRPSHFLLHGLLAVMVLLIGAARLQAQVSSYAFDQSTAAFSSISATGSTIPGITSTNWDNNVSSSQVPFTFTFRFNGVDYTQCNVSSNGFITFGTTAPGTTLYTPISGSSGYAGAVAALGANLTASSAGDLIRYQVLGSTPNRTFVVEWKNVRRKNIITQTVTSDVLNFQIRLSETTNVVTVQYGPTTITDNGFFNTIGAEVGLRGASNAQFNNRTTTADWSATTAGGSNSANCTTNSSVKPINGLLFQWTPPAPCTTPALSLNVAGSTSTSVPASWACAGCTGTYALEYGPSGYTPGTGATAGAGGTLVSANASSPTTISGLSANTSYKVAVRQNCGGGIYTPNSTVIFTTPWDCASAAPITCGASNSLTLVGDGHPVYAGGASPCAATPGAEKLYIFTTTNPGISRLNITDHTGDLLGGFLNFFDYQVAPASGGCAQSAFTCIGRHQGTTSYDLTLPAGSYYLLVDHERTESTSETFSIQCAAPPACVASPASPANGATGLCQPVGLSWAAVTGFPAATGYDVYLNAGNAMPTTLVSSNQAGTSYTPSGLAAGIYSWKVVPRNASGAAAGCSFWTFTVNPEPAGDRAATAITVSTLPATISGNNRASNCVNNDFTTSSTPGNPNAKPGRDVFYKITTSTCTQTLSIGVCASTGGNSFLHLITTLGVNVANNDNAAPAGCTNASSSSITNVAVQPNTTYYIVVESTTLANEFDYTLTITQTVASLDSDGDGTADCADGCPGDPNKVDPGVCGCGVTDADTDLDGVEDCFDECPTDPNKIEPGICGCGVADEAATWYADTDGDGFGDPATGQAGYTCDQPFGFVADATDDCPSFQGRQGDSCNDGNPFTTNDAISGSCTCVGTPVPSHNWTLRIVTDNAGNETTWEVRDVPTNYLMASGGPYPNNSTINQTLTIPDVGNFTLRVFDSGNNGIGNGGGYLLRDQNGNRVIDNTGNGAGFTSVSESPEGFFTPIGNDALRALDCDNLERWPFEMITADPNPAVSAQWQVGNQTDDGYEFWFTDPNGSYSRHIFRNHATSGGYAPADAQRACKLGLASWTVDPVPQGTMLNVRVRGRVNGINLDWGPACRLNVDGTAANCHTTQLENLAGPNFSCGVVGLRTNGSSRIWAKPVSRYVRATNTYIPANKYKFHFVNVGENTSFDILQPSYPMLIYPQMPFALGSSYNVTVQASFDNGATYCPVGASCQISFAATNHREGAALEEATTAGDLLLWPNPNRGDELFLRMTDVEGASGEVTIDVVNMFGERVLGKTLALTDGVVSTHLQLDAQLASGLYLVNLTAGGKTITKRLVIQR